jgi:hypothetical protein
MERPHGTDSGARSVCGDHDDVFAAWQEALNVFGVHIGQGPILNDARMARNCVGGGN